MIRDCECAEEVLGVINTACHTTAKDAVMVITKWLI
jgi:hypothetical protein